MNRPVNISQYRAICQKGDHENMLLDKYTFRILSIYVTVFASKTGAGPNQITLLSLVASLAGCALMLSNTTPAMWAAVVCVFVYHLLDHVDGELARLRIYQGRRQGSISGAYLDVLTHCFTSNLMFFAIGFGLAEAWDASWITLVGVVACIGASQFPVMVAMKVMIRSIAAANGRTTVEMRTAIAAYDPDLSANAVRASWRSPAKYMKIAKELIGYPGQIFLIMGAISVDAVLSTASDGAPMLASFRFLLVVSMAVIGLFRMVYSTSRAERLLRPIK